MKLGLWETKPDVDLAMGFDPGGSPGKKSTVIGRNKYKVMLVLTVTSIALLLSVYSCVGSSLLRQGCCTQAQLALLRQQEAGGGGGRGLGRIRYKHTHRKLPNVLIIGCRKAGTRALLEFLNLHPDIQAHRGEMHFFDDDETYSQGLEWYRKKMPFSFPQQIVIEKTPAYFMGHAVPERVYHMNHTIKLLLIVRDPVERAVSDYTQIWCNKVKRGQPYQSFEDLVTEENGDVNRGAKALRRSVYFRHMERWLEWFPREQFHIVSGEALVRDPSAELEKVERFLGLDHVLTRDNFYFNESKGFFCIRNDTVDKCLASSKGRRHPDVDPHVITKLRTYFRPFNQRFYQLVGTDFGWP